MLGSMDFEQACDMVGIWKGQKVTGGHVRRPSIGRDGEAKVLQQLGLSTVGASSCRRTYPGQQRIKSNLAEACPVPNSRTKTFGNGQAGPNLPFRGLPKSLIS